MRFKFKHLTKNVTLVIRIRACCGLYLPESLGKLKVLVEPKSLVSKLSMF